MPRDGGAAKVYELPELEETPWEAAERLPALDTAVGISRDQGLVFLQDKRRNLLALDLPARRVRTYFRGARAGAVGADGTLYVIDTAGAVHLYTRRTPERLRARFPLPPRRMYATLGNGLLGIDEEGGKLAVLTAADTLRTLDMASGPAAVTVWGDLVAVAADTGVVLYDPSGRQEPRSLRFRAGARAVAFSPSGHHLYVAQDDGQLAVVDRFGLGVLRRIELPGRARDLRPGPLGRWLLARSESDDSVWVVDLEREAVVGTLATAWAFDLPLLTSLDMVVLRDGKDVVARELTKDGLPERGRIEGGVEDFWVVPGWSFSGGRREPPGEDEVVTVADPAAGGATPGDSAAASKERIFLQVSSSRNPAWARELAGKLSEAGLKASVLAPIREGELYRVVLGPYASREEAEASGRSLGMPYFVVSAADTAAP